MRSLQFLDRNGAMGRKGSAWGWGAGAGKQRREEHNMERESRKQMVENSSYNGRYV